MPINRLLEKSLFEPEEIKAMVQAFDAACDKLQLANRDDAFGQLVARKVVDCVRGGVLDPHRMCELVVSEFQQFARDASSTSVANPGSN